MATTIELHVKDEQTGTSVMVLNVTPEQRAKIEANAHAQTKQWADALRSRVAIMIDALPEV